MYDFFFTTINAEREKAIVSKHAWQIDHDSNSKLSHSSTDNNIFKFINLMTILIGLYLHGIIFIKQNILKTNVDRKRERERKRRKARILVESKWRNDEILLKAM